MLLSLKKNHSTEDFRTKNEDFVTGTVTKSRHNKPRLILDLRHVIFFVYKVRIKFDDWRTMQHFVDNKGFFIKVRYKLKVYFYKNFGEGKG